MSFLVEVKQQFRYGWLWLLCGWLMIAWVVYLSLASHVPMPDRPYADKVLHALSYFMLMFWWLQLSRKYAVRVWLGVGFVLMGVLLEVLQGLNPLRYFDVGDMLANATGVFIAAVFGLTAMGRALAYIDARMDAFLH